MAPAQSKPKKLAINNKRISRNNHILEGIAPGDNPDDIWERNRKAVKISIFNVINDYITKELDKDIKGQLEEGIATSLSVEYESCLFDKFKGNIVKYQEIFRKNLIALKSKKTDFAKSIALGKLKPRELIELSPDELMSNEQKLRNDELRERELRASIGESLPENISKIKEQNQYAFVSEKWGLSGSSAAIDEGDD